MEGKKTLLFVNLITNCLDFQSSLPQTYASLTFFSGFIFYVSMLPFIYSFAPDTLYFFPFYPPPPSFQLCAQKIFPKRTAYQFRILFSIYRKNKEQNVKQLKCGRFYILSGFFFYISLCISSMSSLYQYFFFSSSIQKCQGECFYIQYISQSRFCDNDVDKF